MEPSNENQHKNHDDHQPLIVSSESTPHDQEIKNSPKSSSRVVSEEAFLIENAAEKLLENEPAGREKLMSHWKEVCVGGRMVIPERWGQEDLLKEWIDYSTFDALLAPKEAGSAREALAGEARRGGRVSNLRF